MIGQAWTLPAPTYPKVKRTNSLPPPQTALLRHPGAQLSTGNIQGHLSASAHLAESPRLWGGKSLHPQTQVQGGENRTQSVRSPSRPRDGSRAECTSGAVPQASSFFPWVRRGRGPSQVSALPASMTDEKN